MLPPAEMDFIGGGDFLGVGEGIVQTAKYYKPAGAGSASDFRFPYEAGSFDFAFSTSVFTHMLPRDVEHYLAETRRVLRHGGRLLATFFLLNEESLAGIAARRAQLVPGVDLGGHRILSEESPETVVFYDESFVAEALGRHGFVVDPPLMYGNWSGREGGGLQDALVLRKT